VFNQSGPPRRRLIFLICVPALVVTALLAMYRPPFFTRLDSATYDVVLRSAASREPAGRVVIVNVDERSLATVGQWPWRRDVMGRLIRSLHAAGASVIAIDVMFAEPDRYESADHELAAALRETGAVAGYGLMFDPGGVPAHACELHPINAAVVQTADSASGEPFFHATGAVCNLAVLNSAAAHSGFLNAAPDNDGILRRVPLLAELDGRIYPSLALSAVVAANGAAAPELRMSTVNAATLTIGDLSVPVDGKTNLLLAFRGKKRRFPYYSAVDVLNGAVGRPDVVGKIVLIGTTALGTREVVATPLDTQFVGVEVQATAIDNLLQGDFLHRSLLGTSIDTVIVILAGIAVAALEAYSGVTAGVIAAAGLLAVFWWGSAWLISSRHLFISPLSPTLSVVTTLSVMTLGRFVLERGRAIRAGQEKTTTQRLMVQTLLSLTEVRDAETGRHSRRTQQYARLLSERLATHPAFHSYLTRERVELLSQLAPLHDIGKVGISDRVLNKPGALDAEEVAEMRRHPELGREVIIRAESRVGVRDDATLQLAKDIVYTHHEKWDGTGYPQGLRGSAIPIAGRVMAVVDVYDAVHARSLYLPSASHEETVKLIARGRGTHFDPDVVDAFLLVADAFGAVSNEALQG
jgi:adenylate cyclase